MVWNDIREVRPSQYNKNYLVMKKKECENCDVKDCDSHVLGFLKIKYGIAYYKKSDIDFASYCEKNAENKKDCHLFMKDSFYDSTIPDCEITHWVEFPNYE